MPTVAPIGNRLCRGLAIRDTADCQSALQRLYDLGRPLGYGTSVWSNVPFTDVYYQTRGRNSSFGFSLHGAFVPNGRIDLGKDLKNDRVNHRFYNRQNPVFAVGSRPSRGRAGRS